MKRDSFISEAHSVCKSSLSYKVVAKPHSPNQGGFFTQLRHVCIYLKGRRSDCEWVKELGFKAPSKVLLLLFYVHRKHRIEPRTADLRIRCPTDCAMRHGPSKVRSYGDVRLVSLVLSLILKTGVAEGSKPIECLVQKLLHYRHLNIVLCICWNRSGYVFRCKRCILYKFLVLGQIGLSKQCRPRSDCFWRSSLIRVYAVCHSISISWMH